MAIEQRYITEQEMRDLCLLRAMQDAGVDNWDGEYHDRYNTYLEEEGLYDD